MQNRSIRFPKAFHHTNWCIARSHVTNCTQQNVFQMMPSVSKNRCKKDKAERIQIPVNSMAIKKENEGRTAIYQTPQLDPKWQPKTGSPQQNQNLENTKHKVSRFEKRVLQNTRGRFLTSEQNRSSSCTS